jgi:hypothetical protein
MPTDIVFFYVDDALSLATVLQDDVRSIVVIVLEITSWNAA